jgi:hypothetical protein
MLTQVLWVGWGWIVVGSESDGTTTTQFAMYSTDTVTWKRIVMPDTANTQLLGVAYDGNTYMFMGYFKSYATTDFIGFTGINNQYGTRTYTGVAWCGAGSVFAFYGYGRSGTSYILDTLTFNGTTWVLKNFAYAGIFNVGNAVAGFLTNNAGQAVFMTISGGYWFSTQDGGVTWTGASTGLVAAGGDGTGPSQPTPGCWTGSQFVVNFGGKRFTSPDGANWTRDLSKYPEAYTMYCSDGNWIFGHAKSYYFGRSPDQGLNWEITKSTPALDLTTGSCSNLHSVTATSLGLFAYNISNKMFYSNNGGDTWWNCGTTVFSAPATYKLWDCGAFTALFTTATKLFMTYNGLDWYYDVQTTVSSPTLTGSSFTAVQVYCGAGVGGTVVLGGNSGFIDCSQDGGFTWIKNVAKTPAAAANFRGLSWNGSQFLATGAGHIVYSADGVNWNKVTFPTGVGAAGGYHIWTGTYYIMTTNTKEVIVSPDGLTWTKRVTPLAIFSDFASNGSRVVGLVAAGAAQLGTSIAYTDDMGVTWTTVKVPCSGIPYFITCTPQGRFHLSFQVATSFRVWSDDAVTWHTDAMLQPVHMVGMRRDAAGVMYSGNAICALKSTDDGKTWEPRYFGYEVTSWAITNSGQYNVKSQGTMYYSTDGFIWTSKVLGSNYSTPLRNSIDYNPTTNVLVSGDSWGRQVINTMGAHRSTDGGVTWNLLPVPANSPLGNGVWGGSGNTRYLGNNTWFMDYNYIYAYDSCIISFDDGANWTSGPNTVQGGTTFDFCLGEVNGVAVSSAGIHTYYTPSNTWSQTKALTTYNGLGFGNKCFVVTGLTLGAYSYDDGLSWFPMSHGSDSPPAGPCYWDGTSIYAYKTNGTISYLTPPPPIEF